MDKEGFRTDRRTDPLTEMRGRILKTLLTNPVLHRSTDLSSYLPEGPNGRVQRWERPPGYILLQAPFTRPNLHGRWMQEDGRVSCPKQPRFEEQHPEVTEISASPMHVLQTHGTVLGNNRC